MDNRTLLEEFAESYCNYKKFVDNPDSDWQDEDAARRQYEGLLDILTNMLDNYEKTVDAFTSFSHSADKYATMHWNAQCLIYNSKQTE